jgi:hypothetical protein
MPTMRWLAVLCPVVALFWACGGDVVVDGPPSGSGGAGAASSGASPSTGAQGPDTATVGPGPGQASVGPSTSTGPQICSCTEGCNKLVACGDAIDCQGLCASGDPRVEAIMQCACNTASCDFERCFEPVPDECVECLSQPVDRCEAQIDDCIQTNACPELTNCHVECEFDPVCVQGCDMQFPQATLPAYNLLQCAVCQVCFESCQGAPTDLYCLD